MPTINELLKSLLERAKNKDFGLEFVFELLQLSVLVVGWFRADGDDTIYGAQIDDETADLASSLHSELTGQYLVLSGPITAAILAMLIRAAVGVVLDKLAESDWPQSAIDLITQWLEAILARL